MLLLLRLFWRWSALPALSARTAPDIYTLCFVKYMCTVYIQRAYTAQNRAGMRLLMLATADILPARPIGVLSSLCFRFCGRWLATCPWSRDVQRVLLLLHRTSMQQQQQKSLLYTYLYGTRSSALLFSSSPSNGNVHGRRRRSSYVFSKDSKYKK